MGETPVVYVVDDDPSVRKALDRLVRSAGHEVRAFSSALEFLTNRGLETPACLVLDINMPVTVHRRGCFQAIRDGRVEPVKAAVMRSERKWKGFLP